MTDEDLTERLAASVPSAPAVTGWGESARHRYRRTQRLRRVGGTAAVALVVAAVIAVPRLVGEDRRSPDTAGSTSPTMATSPGSSSCPEPETIPPSSGRGRISPGAVGVRVCPGTNEFSETVPLPDDSKGPGEATGGAVLPMDELTENLEAVVDAANNPPLDTGGPCTMDAGPTYQIYFRYADGHKESTQYDDFGCHSGAHVLVAYAEALLAQRSTRTPPDDVPAPTCPGSETILPIPPPLDLSAAAICRYTPDGDEVTEPLDSNLLAQIPTDPPVTYLRTETMNACNKLPVSLVATTVWGDAVVLYGLCGAFRLPHLGYSDRRGEPVWQPTGELGKALNR